ncbi:hypothetical protein D3C83_77560 [compost metagenome]
MGSMRAMSPETRCMAERLAAAQCVPVDEAVRRAIEQSARDAGIVSAPRQVRRRLTVEEMLAVGAEIVAMPLLDRRSPREIMDDLDTR